MTINKSFLNRVLATLVYVALAFITLHVRKTYGIKAATLILLIVFLIPILNRIIRYFYWSKPFIISNLNLFSTKYHKTLMVDLPKDIAFGKFVEVMNVSNLKVQKINHSDYEIFATTGLKWISFGENIYVKFEESNGASRLIFTSVSFKVFDMESNHNNLIDLINEFENSLII